MKKRTGDERKVRFWRRLVLALTGLALVGVYVFCPPIAQDEAYHAFADARPLWAIPRALDVLSNLPFLWIGAIGMQAAGSLAENQRQVWRLLFLGILMVGIGSAYYHWEPTSARLVWDRLPMAFSFMLLLAIVLQQALALPLKPLAWGLPMGGVFSMLLWVWTGDLRLYGCVQFLSIAVMLLLWWRFPLPDGRQQYYWALAFWYGVAKLLEHFDGVVFELLLGTISGHSLKHLAAAAGVYQLLSLVRAEVKAAAASKRPAAARRAKANG